MNHKTTWHRVLDHAGGFDRKFRCAEFDGVLTSNSQGIVSEYVIDDAVLQQYPGLEFKLEFNVKKQILNVLADYKCHPELNFENFICSFNGSAHVSRKLLASILHKFNWFNTEYCSKNFSYSVDILDGHITDYVADRDTYYRKFFISDECENFFQTVNSFGHVRFDHANNIYNLEHRLTQSFLHIVSETMATSYVPFVTEKFLYSVVTRGLFIAYAQPGWHNHLEKYFGFKRYTKLFDYRFDSIQNPVERLIELMTMISKFSVLSTDDWRDLYEMESDTIEFNYDHYFSEDYVKCLAKYSQTV